MLQRWCLILSLGGCHATLADEGFDAAVEEPTERRTYYEACDGSSAIALSADRFLVVGDDEPVARVYSRTGTARPIHELLAPMDPLAGFEDAARVGDRVYAIGSHARVDGAIDARRNRFIAFDVQTLATAGSTPTLLPDLLDAATWDTPDLTAINALRAGSQLDQATVSGPPEAGGTIIEGMAYAPTTGSPSRLLIGFRSPLIDGRAIVTALLNPAEIVVPATRARFGKVATLDLDGLGIRGMTWSDTHVAVLVLAGPSEDGLFHVYRWSGVAGEEPMHVAQIAPPEGASAEAIVAYPDSEDVQILFDADDAIVANVPCKQAIVAERWFEDAVIHVHSARGGY